MTKNSFIEKQENSISVHIFSVSATLVGVCLTVIGIINIITINKQHETIIDDVLAVDAIVFLICCLLSYISLKMEDRAKKLKLELAVDRIFLTGIIVMVLICFMIIIKV